MKCFEVTADAYYEGGIAIVVANTKEEAMGIFSARIKSPGAREWKWMVEELDSILPNGQIEPTIVSEFFI